MLCFGSEGKRFGASRHENVFVKIVICTRFIIRFFHNFRARRTVVGRSIRFHEISTIFYMA